MDRLLPVGIFPRLAVAGDFVLNLGNLLQPVVALGGRERGDLIARLVGFIALMLSGSALICQFFVDGFSANRRLVSSEISVGLFSSPLTSASPSGFCAWMSDVGFFILPLPSYVFFGAGRNGLSASGDPMRSPPLPPDGADGSGLSACFTQSSMNFCLPWACSKSARALLAASRAARAFSMAALRSLSTISRLAGVLRLPCQ